MAAPRSLCIAVCLCGWASIACNGPSNPGEPRFLPDGSSCKADAQCASQHCDSALCCSGSGSTCCQHAAECPAAFRAASTCTVPGAYTDCQGTRRDATCEGYVCGSVEIADDSGCAGQAHDCGGYRPIACTTSAARRPERHHLRRRHRHGAVRTRRAGLHLRGVLGPGSCLLTITPNGCG